jgi:uncharacterized cupin superfamily protein
VPKIDIDAAPWRSGSSYPEPHASAMRARRWKRLGEAGGLTQFGVNLVELDPGATSSLRHWHEAEDEFVHVLSGELVLIQDGGETLMRAGDSAAFRAGDPDGHHFVNRSTGLARMLVVGNRPARDVCHYSDVDLVCEIDGENDRFTRRDGRPVAPSGDPA